MSADNWCFPAVAAVCLFLVSDASNAQVSCMFAAQDHVENPLGFENRRVADAEIAVGTERILTCSNVFLRLLDKSGNVVQFQSPARDAETPLGDYNDSNYPDFMFPVAGNPMSGDSVVIGDPMVYFDYEDERFWVVAVEVHIRDFTTRVHSSVHIAVSTSATPTDWTTSWRKYHYCLWRSDQQCSNTNGVGHNQTIYVDGDTLYIAFLDDEGTERTTTLMMLDKDDLMAGTPATAHYHHAVEDNTTGHQVWGHAIAVEYDAWNNGDPVYTVASGKKPHFPAQHQDTIYIGAIVPNGSTWGYIAHPITGVDLPEWFDNAGTSTTPGGNVAVIGRSFLHATYRPDSQVGGRIWTCHHLRDVDQHGNPVGGNYIRWYEIHTNGWPNSNAPTIAYYGDIKIEGLETYDPSIAVNAAGHIALTWTQSGPNLYPEFWMGVQRSFDAPGTLGYSRKIKDSTVVRTGQKADYSGTEPDPENPCLF